MTDPAVQPVLVLMDYRGGARFERALRSIGRSEHLFSRIVLSVTAPADSPDIATARRYLADREVAGRPSKAELICTEREMPTMEHQRFWVDYLERTGAKADDWIYWLAYDDEVRPTGIEGLVDPSGNWPLRRGTAYFGPWAMRHEKGDAVYDGPWDTPLESWTSFPAAGPTRLPVARWIANQLRQPTYMQMSGSVMSFESFTRLRDSRPRKRGPMRIEMAAASAVCNTHVEEFPQPVVTIYGRPTSDRANYGRAARKEDGHLAIWLARYVLRRPSSLPPLVVAGAAVGVSYARVLAGRGRLPEEHWAVRGTVDPE